MSRRLSARIASRAMARQAQSLTKADDLAAHAELLISKAWTLILDSVEGLADPLRRNESIVRVQAIMSSLVPQLQSLFGRSLLDTARWAHRWTADAVASETPIRRLKAQVTESIRRGPSLERDMPDYRQLDDYDCGAACVHAVAMYFGIDDDRQQADYIRELGTTKSGGTHPDAITRWFARRDMPVATVSGMTVDELRIACESGRPIICPIQRPEATATQAAQNAAGHYVIVLDVTANDVVYQDPLSGQESVSHELFDSRWHDIESDGQYSDHCGIIIGRERVALREKIADSFDGKLPGFIRLRVNRLRQFAVSDLLSPIENADVSDEAKRDLFRELIFPPMSFQRSHALVYAGNWMERLAAETRLAAPQEVARVVMDATAGAQSIRDLAKALQPVVNGVRSTARRIARDETLRVAHTAQWQAWQEVDELIVGYQVFAVDRGHSPQSRPEHRKRHGTIYYKSPEPGQEPMSECPHPPYEANGQIAFNCRCWLAPVFAPEESDPFSDAPSSALDPGVASEWFDRVGARDRRAAVGAANYNMAEAALGRRPEWKDFTDAAGNVLDSEQLRRSLPFRRSA